MVRSCQRGIVPIICRAASLNKGRLREPTAGRYTSIRWAAGGPIYLC